MNWPQWALLGFCAAFLALAVRYHISYKREVKRAKGSRWATWLDAPRGYDDDSPNPP